MDKLTLINKINKIIKNTENHIAILVKDLCKDEVVFKYNEEKAYVSASIIKVPIMIEALSRVNKEANLTVSNLVKIKDSDKVEFSIITEQDLKECTYEELIEWMIIASDNTATNVLIDILGIDKINNLIKDLGMKNTIFQRRMMDFKAIENGKNNYTSLEDMLKVMEGLYGGTILSENELYKKAINILKNQRDNGMLKRYIKENVVLANKTGELDNLNNDVGIFYTENTDYFIGVFAQELSSNQEGYKIIGEISKVVYEYFN